MIRYSRFNKDRVWRQSRSEGGGEIKRVGGIHLLTALMLRAGDKKRRNWQTLGMQLSMGTKFIQDAEEGNGERKTRDEGGKEDSVMSH